MNLNSLYSAPISTGMDEISKKNNSKIENDLHLKPLVTMDKTIDNRLSIQKVWSPRYVKP